MLTIAKSSTLLKTIVIIVVLVVVLAAGWTVWKNIKGGPINSYKACADAGNPIQLSYPSVCVTKDGKHFVNPDEHLN